VRHQSQDLARQLLGKKYGTLGLATAAQAAPRPATEGQKVFGTALRATDPCKTSLKPATT